MQVVVLYRARVGQKTDSRAKAKARSQEDRLKDILAARNVHLRCFRDVPMADLDIVFPEKTVRWCVYSAGQTRVHREIMGWDQVGTSPKVIYCHRH